jgi:F0F1-type ATP synthase membrane subunit b/b'
MRPLSGQLSPGASSRYASAFLVLLMLLPGALALKSFAQVVDDRSSPDQQQVVAIETRLDQLTETLSQTEKMLEKSRAEIQALRSQLEYLRAQTGVASQSGAAPRAADEGHAQDLDAIREQQDAMQAEIKQHEQTKVETFSKYPLRLSGLILFNASSNAGVVDNAQLPTIAYPRIPGESHGSSGATLRQTLLTLDATGPRIAGARSSAEVSVDFFGGASTNSYGYSSSGGLLRMRQTWVNLDWYKTTAQAGYTVPLISPLSPTSYATVAVPALTGSGNLWTWSPQLQVEQRIPITEQRTIGLQAGLIDPPVSGYISDQLDSPVEASRHPGYEGRISYRADGSWKGVARPFALGVSAYSAHQLYNSATQIHSWAATGDWQFPIFKWFGLSGEAYRGRSLGGFGGGAYKDIFTGTDALTGLTRTTGVATAGGWSQLKFIASSTLQANVAFGLDDAFTSNFDGFNPSSTSVTPLNARNRSVLGNLIYRPKSYLILSPEYRRIQTWPYNGSSNIANIFTMTAGFEF